MLTAFLASVNCLEFWFTDSERLGADCGVKDSSFLFPLISHLFL